MLGVPNVQTKLGPRRPEVGESPTVVCQNPGRPRQRGQMSVGRSLLLIFFFAKGEEKSQSTSATSEPTTVTQNPRNGNPPITSAVVGVLSLGSTILQERLGEGPRTRASQYHAPSPGPCQFGAGPEGGRFLTRLRPRELSEESLRLQGPSASHFTCEEQPVWLFHVRRVLDTLRPRELSEESLRL